MLGNVVPVVSAQTMSSTNTFSSNPIPLDQVFGIAIQAVWTGTPNGTVKLQASCDPPSQAQIAGPSYSTVTNWTDVANSSYSITGSAGNYMWNVADANYRWIRLTYTNTSGTGSMTAYACVKGI